MCARCGNGEADLLAARDKRWKFVVFSTRFRFLHDHFEQQQMRLLAPAFEKGGRPPGLHGSCAQLPAILPDPFQNRMDRVTSSSVVAMDFLPGAEEWMAGGRWIRF